MPPTKGVWESSVMLLLGSFYAESAFACSLVNAVASTANSVTVSGYYLLVSGVLGGLIICIELLQRRRPLILAVTTGLLAFHPTWTIAPAYGPRLQLPEYGSLAICAGDDLSGAWL